MPLSNLALLGPSRSPVVWHSAKSTVSAVSVCVLLDLFWYWQGWQAELLTNSQRKHICGSCVSHAGHSDFHLLFTLDCSLDIWVSHNSYLTLQSYPKTCFCCLPIVSIQGGERKPLCFLQKEIKLRKLIILSLKQLKMAFLLLWSPTYLVKGWVLHFHKVGGHRDRKNPECSKYNIYMHLRYSDV